MTFHSYYGVPERFPAPLAITPEIIETMTSLSPAKRAEYLVLKARNDFLDRFPVIGEFGGARGCGGSDRAWLQHGHSYLAHVFGAYLADIATECRSGRVAERRAA